MINDRDGTEARLIQKYAELEGKTILEVGCGNGRASIILSRDAGKLIAIDPDAEQLAIARSNVPGVDFRLGSGESLEFPDRTFDIVAYTFSLHHQESARALKEAHRVLRQDGQVLVIEPSVEGEMHRFFRTFRDEDQCLGETLNSLRDSRIFKLDRSETFCIEWVFDDKEDLYDYFFTHFRMARNPNYIGKMDKILGKKKADKPIVLAEVVTIFSMTKI